MLSNIFCVEHVCSYTPKQPICLLYLWTLPYVLTNSDVCWTLFKGTVMQIEKALIHDRLSVSKVSWKSRIATIYNFAVIYAFS